MPAARAAFLVFLNFNLSGFAGRDTGARRAGARRGARPRPFTLVPRERLPFGRQCHTHAPPHIAPRVPRPMNMLQARYIQSGSPGNSFQPVHTRSCFSWLALSVALGRAEATKACTWFG